MNKAHGLPAPTGDRLCHPLLAMPCDTQGIAIGVNSRGEPLAQWTHRRAAVSQRPEDTSIGEEQVFVPVRPREDTPRPWLRQGAVSPAAPLSWRQKCERRQPKRWAVPLVRLTLLWCRLDAQGDLVTWLLGTALLVGCALGVLLVLG